MTAFTELTAAEQCAVNQSRIEAGKPPLGPRVRSIQASASALPEPASPSGFAQELEAAVATRLGTKRYTKPSEPQGEPHSFAEKLKEAVERRRSKPKAANPSAPLNWRP
jgi:hypothetical protein